MKKRLYNLLKVIWFLFGVLIFLWNLLWFIEIPLSRDIGIFVGIIFFIWGLIFLGIYVIMTILFLLIRGIVNKLKRRKIRLKRIKKEF